MNLVEKFMKIYRGKEVGRSRPYVKMEDLRNVEAEYLCDEIGNWRWGRWQAEGSFAYDFIIQAMNYYFVI